ncbi:MAG: DUF87 domain-containing protein [Candidatus Eremiobacteraeota bacterium]|nr:DUF87 domain-containing protein [Candidatus Eremiobacteraeota bacterium]
MIREFRTSVKGYADVLPYAALIDDGIVLNKDGSLLAAYEYRGNDLDSASQLELDALSERMNGALKRRGSGWMMHVDAIRSVAGDYAPVGAFPDRTTQLVDEERRLQYRSEGAHFETRYVLALTYLPPADREDKFVEMFIEGDKAENETPATRAMRTFRAALADLEDNLAFNLRFRRLKKTEVNDGNGGTFPVDELLCHLNYCVTADERPVRLPKLPMYLDAVLGGVDFYGGLRPRIGTKHIRAIGITGLPNESTPGILEPLNRLPMSYRFSSRFIFLDPPDARKRIESSRKKWFINRKSMRGFLSENTGSGPARINNDADAMANDAQAALDDLSADRVRFGYYTSTIVVTDDDPVRADEKAREVLKIIFNLGFNARIEEVNAVEAFLGTHPGNGFANVRKPLIHTRNLADFLPLTTIWSGEEHNPCPFYPPDSPPLAFAATSGATPFRLNLHVGDVGHTLILGPTGAGKSTLLGLLAASHFRYPNAQVFVFDKGYSALPLVWGCGGEHYDIMGEGDGPSFCPLAHVDDVAERAWAAEWLENVVALQGVTVTPAHRQAIYQALTLLAESESRTITDLLHGPLQNRELRAALERYALDGPLGMLLDARDDSLREDMFQVFELEHLMQSGSASARNVVPVLLYLFHRIEQRLDGRPTLLILDEAWTFIDNALFAEKIRDWLKTLRKKNAAVVFATQSVSDILERPITAALLESCPTKIFLPNAEARSQNASAAYKRIGLTDRQIEILSYAKPKRQYYLTSPLGQRLFDLGLGPVALAFVGASGKEDLQTVRMLRERYGVNEWPAEWLWRRNMPVAAARWLGGTEREAVAMQTLERYRETWPAEWLRAIGQESAAHAWLERHGAVILDEVRVARRPVTAS